MLYDVIILGAGPAGLSAALYAGRACLKTLLIEKAMPGGQITLTNDIENYPGQLLEGESGFSLTERMGQQADRFGVERAYDEITAVDFTGDLSKLSAPLELVGGARYEFSSVPPFSTITNLDSRRAEVTLKSPGVYDLSNCAFDGKIRLILEDGARIDLGGGVLNVYQFLGNPAAVDGTVKPAVPCLGTVMIIR